MYQTYLTIPLCFGCHGGEIDGSLTVGQYTSFGKWSSDVCKLAVMSNRLSRCQLKK
jgi:hypothetical protein